jgi:metallo-beta-lactamase family protein
VPHFPAYVHSPTALKVYRQAIAAGSPKLNPALRAEADPFNPGRLVETRTVAPSIAINDQHFPSIIIAASGMATGGRVLHQLSQRLSEAEKT